MARRAGGLVQWAAAPAFPRPFAVGVGAGCGRLLKGVTDGRAPAARWRDDGGGGGRRLRAERRGGEAALRHGGRPGAEKPVVPASCPSALPPAADATRGGSRGHGAEPGEGERGRRRAPGCPVRPGPAAAARLAASQARQVRKEAPLSGPGLLTLFLPASALGAAQVSGSIRSVGTLRYFSSSSWVNAWRLLIILSPVKKKKTPQNRAGASQQQ